MYQSLASLCNIRAAPARSSPRFIRHPERGAPSGLKERGSTTHDDAPSAFVYTYRICQFPDQVLNDQRRCFECRWHKCCWFLDNRSLKCLYRSIERIGLRIDVLLTLSVFLMLTFCNIKSIFAAWYRRYDAVTFITFVGTMKERKERNKGIQYDCDQ